MTAKSESNAIVFVRCGESHLAALMTTKTSCVRLRQICGKMASLRR